MKSFFLLCLIVPALLLCGCAQEPRPGAGAGAAAEYGCDYSWYQKITDKATGEIVWACPGTHPYCKTGTAQCCKYDDEKKEHFDCIDCRDGRCSGTSPAYRDESGKEPDEAQTCSNAEYSTEIANDSWAYGWDKFIELDWESQNRLRAKAAEEGSTALQGISDLGCIEYLDLSAFDYKEYKGITSIAALSAVSSLKVLRLKATPVSDLSPISGLTNLEELDLIGADISSLSAISGLKKLKVLRINLTDVSDLSPLGGLASLEYFSMNRVKVTDISPLAGLKSLKDADLMYNEQIPQQDCIALREQLPNTDVCCPGIGCDPRFN
ncbi:MAG: hypothetical protein V1676_00985 [Candidatus Diapherotrites archaeon]